MNQKDVDNARKRMRNMVARYQKYVAAYSDQPRYEDYMDKTYLDDMLYGLGISIIGAADYGGPEGYERFKQLLREHLK